MRDIITWLGSPASLSLFLGVFSYLALLCAVAIDIKSESLGSLVIKSVLFLLSLSAVGFFLTELGGFTALTGLNLLFVLIGEVAMLMSPLVFRPFAKARAEIRHASPITERPAR